MGFHWLMNHSRWPRIVSERNITNPSQCRPAKTMKRGRLLEEIIGCHSEAVRDKTVKNLLWNENHCFRGVLFLSDVFFCMFLSVLSVFLFPQIPNHAPAWLVIFLPFLIPPSMRSQKEYTKPFQGI